MEATMVRIMDSVIQSLQPLSDLVARSVFILFLVAAALLIIMAISLSGVESRDVRHAKRFLRGDLSLSDKERHRIADELAASDNEHYRYLAHQLCKRDPLELHHHLPL